MRRFDPRLPRIQMRKGKAYVLVDFVSFYSAEELGLSGNEIYFVLILADNGFVSDGASVPWLFTRIVPRFGKNTNAAIIHDALYSQGVLSRKVADRIFRFVQGLEGVPCWKRFLCYISLRLFGGLAWAACKRQRTKRKEEEKLMSKIVPDLLDEMKSPKLEGNKIGRFPKRKIRAISKNPELVKQLMRDKVYGEGELPMAPGDGLVMTDGTILSPFVEDHKGTASFGPATILTILGILDAIYPELKFKLGAWLKSVFSKIIPFTS